MGGSLNRKVGGRPTDPTRARPLRPPWPNECARAGRPALRSADGH